MDLSGIWGLENTPFLELTVDGSLNVRGRTFWHAKRLCVQAAINKGSFNAATGTLNLEGHAPSFDGKGESHYTIEGRLENDLLSVTYDIGGLTGSHTFRKLFTPLG